jgi:hypothetical protein
MDETVNRRLSAVAARLISNHFYNGVLFIMQRGSISGFVARLYLSSAIILRTTTLLLVPAFVLFIGTGVTANQEREKSRGIRPDGALDFLGPAGKPLTTITIEIADTEELRNRGLMWRTGLDDTMGMLFEFGRAQPLTFWMRNTPTALDIIFLSTEKTVINIAADTAPMSDTIYSSQAPAQYVVEVPAGFCRRHQVLPGMQVRWKRMHSTRSSP